MKRTSVIGFVVLASSVAIGCAIMPRQPAALTAASTCPSYIDPSCFNLLPFARVPTSATEFQPTPLDVSLLQSARDPGLKGVMLNEGDKVVLFTVRSSDKPNQVTIEAWILTPQQQEGLKRQLDEFGSTLGKRRIPLTR